MDASRSGGTASGWPTQVLLPPELRSVRRARVFVSQACSEAGLTGRRRDDALLLASELVTNAVLHGRSEVCVEVALRRGRLRIAVIDENSRHPKTVAEDPDALDGRGLALVDALATRWGVDDRPMGKAVWFELALS